MNRKQPPPMGARSIPLTDEQRAQLRAVRAAKGLSQSQLAERIGATVKHVSEIERGAAPPSPQILAAICEALGFSLAVVIQPHGRTKSLVASAEQASLAETLGATRDEFAELVAEKVAAKIRRKKP